MAAAANHTPNPPDKSGIAAMFGRIVGVYDVLNRLLSLGMDQHWRACLAETALLGLSAQARQGTAGTVQVLDIAAGTLDVSLKLTRVCPACTVTALDFCLPMLVKGKGKLRGASPIFPVGADARKLPLPDACAHAVTMAFGIRNIEPRSEALREMCRVLRPGGRVCFLEFSPPARPVLSGLYNFYLHTILPLIGRMCSGDNAYAYLARSIQSFPAPDAFAAELKDAGFARVYHVPLTAGIVRLHVGEKA